jgi:hypothetical protein
VAVVVPFMVVAHTEQVEQAVVVQVLQHLKMELLILVVAVGVLLLHLVLVLMVDQE